MEITIGHLLTGGVLLVGVTTLMTKITNGDSRKHAAIYDKIEAERKEADDKFMPATLCHERSGNMEKQLTELKTGQTAILTEIRKQNGKT